MSTFSNPDGTTMLHLKFPEKKFEAILFDLNLPISTDFQDAKFEDKKLVFLVAFREFLKGKLFLEELSEISYRLKTSFNPESKTKEQEEYEQMIYEASDLGYYVRTIENPEKSMFAAFLKGCSNYFEKNKYLLKNLPEKYSTPASFEEKKVYKSPVFLPTFSEIREKIKRQGGS